MNRKIKYRAYNTKWEMMVQIHTVLLDDQWLLWVQFYNEDTDWNLHDEERIDGKENLIVMQYTWLKDNNGVEIYEWDICKIYYSRNQNEIWVCVYYYDRFTIQRKIDYKGQKVKKDYLKYNWETEIYRWIEIEVIWNIYEHPHLLSINTNA